VLIISNISSPIAGEAKRIVKILSLLLSHFFFFKMTIVNEIIDSKSPNNVKGMNTVKLNEKLFGAFPGTTPKSLYLNMFKIIAAPIEVKEINETTKLIFCAVFASFIFS
jgi:hypothetical protein